MGFLNGRHQSAHQGIRGCWMSTWRSEQTSGGRTTGWETRSWPVQEQVQVLACLSSEAPTVVTSHYGGAQWRLWNHAGGQGSSHHDLCAPGATPSAARRRALASSIQIPILSTSIRPSPGVCRCHDPHASLLVTWLEPSSLECGFIPKHSARPRPEPRPPLLCLFTWLMVLSPTTLCPAPS